MPTEIYLVKAGMTMTEGIVEEWYVPDGGTVAIGQLLYRLETEKINLDVDAEAGGTVKHLVEAGVTKEPGDVVGYIYAPGEVIPAASKPAASKPQSSEPATPEPGAPASRSDARRAASASRFSSPAARRLAGELKVDINSLEGTGPGGRIVEADVKAATNRDADRARVAAVQAATQMDAERAPASPVARRRAEALGVSLARVRGTGPGGRITKEDVEAAAAASAKVLSAAPIPGSGSTVPGSGSIPLKGMRRTIAQRMFDSLRSSAQLTMDMTVTMDDAVRLREQLIDEWRSDGVRPTYTDLVVRAVAKALRSHPRFNSRFSETEILLLDEIHVGIAVALDEGLVVPVIRNADRLSLKALVGESARLAEAARSGKLGMDDMAGGTFTVSALGMFGVDSFTPILNSPESGILGVNRLYDGVAWEGDKPVRRSMMRLSLTWDHRVLDGAPAARFLGYVKELLEAPYRLLV